MRIQAIALIAAFAALPLSAFGQDSEVGRAAHIRGDYATALQEYRPMAEQGNAIAQYRLGLMHSYGHGVLQDYEEALRWFRLSAEQGHAGAQTNLGFLYSVGRGVLLDDVEAVRWYRLAAEQGDAFAQGSLGLMYEEGLGVPQDFVMAHMWINLAITNGAGISASTRDAIARRMSTADVSEAQRRARECMASSYENCN